MALLDLTEVEVVQEQGFSDSTYHKDRFLKIPEGYSIIMRLLRASGSKRPSEDALHHELRVQMRSISYYQDNTKPEAVRGYSLELPQLSFEDRENNQYDPMTWIMKHPEQYLKKPGTSKYRKVDDKPQWLTVVQASDPFKPVNAFDTKWDATKYPLKEELKVWKHRKGNDQRQWLVEFCEFCMTNEGKLPTQSLFRLTHKAREGNAKYGSYELNHLPVIPAGVDLTEVPEIDINLKDFVFYQTFPSQKKYLSSCGYNLPFDDPDNDVNEEDTEETEE